MELEPQATSLLPSQQQLMLRIQHLAGLDSNLVIIAGREGAGKHTLASALVEQYSDEYDLAWLEVSSKSSDSVVRAQVLNQLFADTAYDPDEPLQHSVNQILGDTGGKQMIVLTHADRLSNQLLVELWSLVENSRQLPAGTHHISVLMFADPIWANRVSREMAAITEADQPVLQIPSLPLEERKQLFSQLQQRLGHNELEVDLVERQLNDQDGLPGEIVALCDVATPVVVDDDETPGDNRQPMVVAKTWLIAAAVGLLLLVVILWWAMSSEPESQQAASLATPEPMTETVLATEPDDTTVRANEAQESKPIADNAPLEQLPEQLPEATVTTEVEDESDKQRIEVDEQALTSIAAKQALDTPTEPAIEQRLEPVTESKQQAEPEVVEVAPQPVAVPTPEPEALAPAPESIPAVKSQPWWQQLDGKEYVLQLGVMSSQTRLDAFAKRYGLNDDLSFRQYLSQRKDNLVYIGVYGSYPSAAAARQAINALPSQVQALKPWPKSVATIQQEAVGP
ncbi:cell division protein DamX [Neiella marina]|uniref:Cell division protein DamX n=1 Tax=Neiella marina TaxID=508461 RepID=A0A8J2U1U7_9GAMM|nr:AAA family ATPase [Neiella marina]GGA63769.1 cell division protein DamX [Neiella marina]